MDKVHLDIVYGDSISQLGFRLALLLIDRATKYIWLYGLRNLQSDGMIDAFEQLRADAGGMPKELCCDCNTKLLEGGTHRWIYKQVVAGSTTANPIYSEITGAPSGRQSSNGLAERAWETVSAMARAYLTEEQIP